MADLKVIVEPKGDEFSVAVTIPASRYGGQNFGALAKTLLVLRTVVPDAFDPQPSAPEIAQRDGHTADGAGLVLAEQQFEAACSGPALNHAGGDIAE